MRIGIKVIPNSGKFRIRETANGFAIYVTANADKGKANTELVKELSHALNRQVQIIRGLKSRNKVVEIEGPEEEAVELLRKNSR